MFKGCKHLIIIILLSQQILMPAFVLSWSLNFIESLPLSECASLACFFEQGAHAGLKSIKNVLNFVIYGKYVLKKVLNCIRADLERS